MSKTMAEVLLRHWSRSTHTDSEPFVDKCDGCGEVVHTWGEPTDPNEGLAAHQAAVLSAAGFGLVADAKAEALERVEAITDEMDQTAALRAVNADVKSYYGSRIRAAVAAAKGDERG